LLEGGQERAVLSFLLAGREYQRHVEDGGCAPQPKHVVLGPFRLGLLHHALEHARLAVDEQECRLYSPCSQNDGLPSILINTNPEPVEPCFGLRIPSYHTWLHPYATQDAIVGWRSPISSVVHISGLIKDVNPGCGNGIRWFVDRVTTTLADGKIDDGGKQGLPKGLSTTVSAGHFLYVIIDARAQDFCADSTRVRFTITG
jgi:hypothetical protein